MTNILISKIGGKQIILEFTLPPWNGLAPLKLTQALASNLVICNMCLDLIVVTRDRGGEGEKRNVEKFENYNFLKLARRPPPLNPGRKPEDW